MSGLPSHEVLREQFPIIEQVVYANHASISPWPRDTLLAVQRCAEKHHQQGPLVYSEWLQEQRQLRALCAKMLNARSADDIALLKNTTEGINLVAQGMDWRPGDNIVSTAQEFISNRLPWEILGGRGVELRRVDIRANPDPEQALLDAMDERTRLLAISSVQWSDGFRLQLQPLGAACRSAGVVFFVDAIQQFGALRLDVLHDHVDMLCAGSHKWQLGPEGIAVCYIHPRLRQRLAPSQWGWHMLEQRFQFDAPGREPVTGARRYEAGTPNTIGQVALHASLSLLDAIGAETVERTVLNHTQRLLAGLAAIPGVRVTSATGPERRSGIVSFACRSHQPAAFVSALRDRGVVAIRRGESIRLSPHFYQPARQIDSLLAAVEHTAATAHK